MGAEAIVKALEMEGIEHVFTFPGGGVYEIINTLHEEPAVKTILVRHERVACDMADGYARSSGKPCVVLVSRGPGGAHAFAGLAQSYADSVPVLLLTSHVKRRNIGKQAFQEIRNLDVFRTVTKWVERVNLVERIPELMRRAFTTLRSGRPRPVALEIPEDVSCEEADGEKLVYKPVRRGWRQSGDPRDVESAVKALVEARSPLIHAGAGVLYAGGSDELRELAELLWAPVTTTLNGKSAFPEDHPLSLGLAGAAGTKQAAHFLRKADVVLAIGNSFMRLGIPVLEDASLIHVNVDELEINKNRQVDFAILGDAKLVLMQMIEAVKRILGGGGRGKDEHLTREIERVKEEWLEEWMPKLTSDEVPINPFRVTWDLMHTVDRRNTIVIHDAGLPRWHVSHHYEALFPRGYIGMGGESEMGWSLGAAMGAKLANPDKLVINIMGDGAFGMTGLDLETAVRNSIPILTVVSNNSGLGQYFERTPSTAALSGHYAKVAEGLGAYAERVENPEEIIPSVERAKKALGAGRPALLEIITKVEGTEEIRAYWKDFKAVG